MKTKKVTSEPPRLLSVEDSAQLLGIGRSLAYELIQKGTLHSLKVGRRRLIPREAIDAFIGGFVGGEI